MNKSLNNIKNTGFKVPEGYFDGVEESVFSQIKTDILKETISDTGFKTPDSYFDTLEDKVLNEINGSETKVISIFSRRNLYYVSGIAAAILILFAVFIDKNTSTSEELNYEMVENYILDQDLSVYEMAQLLSDAGLENSDLEIIENEFTEESLEEYLLDNIDLEDIIEQ